MAHSDSDDENDPFRMFRNGKILDIEEEEGKNVLQEESTAIHQSIVLNTSTSMCSIIDNLFLRKDIHGLEALTYVLEASEDLKKVDEATR